MIGLLQRVTEASVDVDGSRIGAIGPGLLVLACAERGDSELDAERLVERMLNYRVFSDVRCDDPRLIDAPAELRRKMRSVAGSLPQCP